MRFQLVFDVDDLNVQDLRSLIERPEEYTEIRCGFACIRITNLELTQYEHKPWCGDPSLSRPDDRCTCAVTPEMQLISNSVRELKSAVLETLHDLCNRYGCGGTADHELVSDVLQNIETGIRNRLEGK